MQNTYTFAKMLNFAHTKHINVENNDSNSSSNTQKILNFKTQYLTQNSEVVEIV